MSERSVAVTGVGLVTPAGLTSATTWQRVLAGLPTATADPVLAGTPSAMSCRVPAPADQLDRLLDSRHSWRLSRASKLALLAAREAVHHAGLDPARWDGARVAVILGTAVGDADGWADQSHRLTVAGPGHVSPRFVPMSLVHGPVGEVAADLGAHGPSMSLSTACASGATAISVARDLLLSGQCDIAVAGGTEAAVTPLMVSAFARMGALSTRDHDPAAASRPFAADRDGFVIGEGAAILVLERTEQARAAGRRALAHLLGCGSSSDAHHPTAPHPTGRGAEQALRAALADARLIPGQVDHVNAHGTSTPLNDSVEAALIDRVLPHGPSVTAAKGVTGHGLGAAGAIEAALTTLSLHHGMVPPIANHPGSGDGPANPVIGSARPQDLRVAISTSLGFGGHNSVLVLGRPA